MRAGARPEAAVRQRGRPFFLVKGPCPFFPALPQAGRAIFFNTVLRSGGLYGRIVFLISQPDGRQPRLLITVALTLGVIFVNGWTDAPNAIATCVTTRCMNVRAAILMSAAFNFLGVFVMTKINSSVASTISNMVDFGGDTLSLIHI